MYKSLIKELYWILTISSHTIPVLKITLWLIAILQPVTHPTCPTKPPPFTIINNTSADKNIYMHRSKKYLK